VDLCKALGAGAGVGGAGAGAANGRTDNTEEAREARELEKMFMTTLLGLGSHGLLPVLALNDPAELRATRDAVLATLVATASMHPSSVRGHLAPFPSLLSST